jgi:hypothetical protein
LVCDDVFHTSMLRRELFPERIGESGELLQGSVGTGQSHQSGSRRTPF